LVRPVIAHVNAPVVVHTLFPGVEVTLYPVIAAPPSNAGAVQVIVERPDSAPVARTPLAAPGTVDGVAVFDGSDAVLVPALFVAVTVNVYAVPLTRARTTHVVRVVGAQVAPTGEDVTR